ncbi:MAG TPA: CopD family protein [Gemmatimonadaceae bacterium]|nr:CopD family protein [Gemmatimonadaceae bacterium]
MMIRVALLLADADIDFTAIDVIHEYISFVGTFCIVGAAAFYFLLLRPALSSGSPAMGVASRAAARIGILGGVLRLLSILMSVNGAMNSKHITFMEALTRRPAVLVGTVVTVIAILAFAAAAFAASGALLSWTIAGIATLVIALRGVLTTELDELVNPVHVFAASMWIGTLFVLVIAGLTTLLSGAVPPNERDPAIASMVNRFTTIALWSTGVLVLTGLTTAWLHLGSIPALWTSIYGRTLMVKLCLVAIVFWLGGYNNLRMKPAMGTEDGARKLKRSATFEIGVAAIVLIVTAVLVNLPAPAEHMAH